MTDQELEAFVRGSMEDLVQKQARLEVEYGFGSHARWDYDQSTERLEFFDSSDTRVLEAEVLFLGSYAPDSSTWKWAWSNEFLLPHLREKAACLKELASITGLDLFESGEAVHLDDESMAWELAAMCVRHLGAFGAYRAPSSSQPWAIFLAIQSLKECVR